MRWSSDGRETNFSFLEMQISRSVRFTTDTWQARWPTITQVLVQGPKRPPVHSRLSQSQGLYTPPHIPCGLHVDSRSTPGVHVEFRHFFFGGSPAKFLSRIHLESNRSPPGLQLLHLDNMESTSEHGEYEITQQDSIWSPHGLIAFNSVIPFII